MVLVLLLCVIAPALVFADSSAGMVSVHEALGLYGFEGGKYNPYESRVYDIEYETFDKFAFIEGDEYSLDTPEEFLTAVYFSPIEIGDGHARARLEELYPQDNAVLSGTRLGAMLFPARRSCPS